MKKYEVSPNEVPHPFLWGYVSKIVKFVKVKSNSFFWQCEDNDNKFLRSLLKFYSEQKCSFKDSFAQACLLLRTFPQFSVVTRKTGLEIVPNEGNLNFRN